jgi:hypothetical protein
VITDKTIPALVDAIRKLGTCLPGQKSTSYSNAYGGSMMFQLDSIEAVDATAALFGATTRPMQFEGVRWVSFSVDVDGCSVTVTSPHVPIVSVEVDTAKIVDAIRAVEAVQP